MKYMQPYSPPFFIVKIFTPPSIISLPPDIYFHVN